MSPEWYFDVPENEIVAVRWLKQVKKEMDENNGWVDIQAQIANRPKLPFDPKSN